MKFKVLSDYFINRIEIDPAALKDFLLAILTKGERKRDAVTLDGKIYSYNIFHLDGITLYPLIEGDNIQLCLDSPCFMIIIEDFPEEFLNYFLIEEDSLVEEIE